MPNTARLTTLLLLGALGVLAAASPTKADETACAAAAETFNAASASGDLDTIVGAYEALTQAGCEELPVFCAGQGVALAHLSAGYAASDRGASNRAIKEILLEGRKFGAPWQLLVGLADLGLSEARATQDAATFMQSTIDFQDALNTISEPPLCSDGSGMPSDAEIESIYTRMSEAQSLAPDFEMIRTRSGTCGGIFLQSIRGFTPTFRPLPINFEFDQAEFTPSGRKAADVLLACVKEEGRDRVVLSGHTDAKGTDAYNLALSERRLQRVANFLRDGGFTGQLELLPKGESEPFQADDPTAYSEAEIDQLNRRVVLREPGR